MIETKTVKRNPPRAYDGEPGWETVEPVIQVGDKVTIENYWVKPVVGVVDEIYANCDLIKVAVPVAVPAGAGTTIAITTHNITKVERGEEVWERQ